MKKNYMLFVALAVAATTSCTSDDEAQGTDTTPDGGARTVTLTASTPAPDGEKPAAGKARVGLTKTSSTTATFHWQENDKILVQTKSDGTYGQAEFALEGTATGSTSATFKGELTGSVGKYAVYPYSAAHKFDTSSETKLTYNLPSSYTYATVESGIFSKTENGSTTYRTTQTNIPMLGTITDSKVAFKILGGLAVIRIDNMPATAGTLTVTADQQLSGDFTVSDMSATDAAIATSSSTSSDNTVTFGFSGATEGSAGVFFLPLATGTYSDLKITVATGSKTQAVNYGDLTIARCDVTAIALTTDSEGNLRHIEKIDDYHYKINGHEFVDLGLDVLWATMNVGASSETEDGYHLAWGATTEWEDHNYTSSTYSSRVTTFVDAATANWGSGVRMPTTEEFNALINGCTRTWKWVDENYTSTSDPGGYTLTSQASGNTSSIFLYRPKYYQGTTLSYYSEHSGYYWTSSGTTSKAGYIGVSSDKNSMWSNTGGAYYGYAVRPVAPKP